MEQSKPKFNNTHNKVYKTKDGDKWDSRAVALVNHIWFVKNGNPFLLIGKRGHGGDNPGKYNVPCGYLDWNENLLQGRNREVWEETGLDLSKNYGSFYLNTMDQPWFVFSGVLENKQNVSMHMGLVVDYVGDSLPELSLDNMEEDECESVHWMHYNDVMNIPDEDWAFNHKQRIIKFKEYLFNFNFKFNI